MERIVYVYSLQAFLAFLLCFGFIAPLSPAETVRDDFDSPELNIYAWEVVGEGKGTYSIEDGQLILESPGVSDGVILYFKQEIQGDVTVECQLDPTNVDPGTLGTVGFTDGIFAPEPSPDFWVHWLAHFNYSPTNTTPFVDNYPGENGFPAVGGAINCDPESHIWKFEVSGDKVRYYLDGEDLGESDRGSDFRYFHVSPDTYTSHYFGTVAIDYIEITGNSVKSLAVSPSGKLALTWGMTKKGKKGMD